MSNFFQNEKIEWSHFLLHFEILTLQPPKHTKNLETNISQSHKPFSFLIKKKYKLT